MVKRFCFSGVSQFSYSISKRYEWNRSGTETLRRAALVAGRRKNWRSNQITEPQTCFSLNAVQQLKKLRTTCTFTSHQIVPDRVQNVEGQVEHEVTPGTTDEGEISHPHLHFVLLLLGDFGEQFGFLSGESVDQSVTLCHETSLNLHAALLKQHVVRLCRALHIKNMKYWMYGSNCDCRLILLLNIPYIIRIVYFTSIVFNSIQRKMYGSVDKGPNW